MPLSYFQRYGAKRLLKLADILDTADAAHKARGEPAYDQQEFVHSCGTPACALGHYAVIPSARRRGWALTRGSDGYDGYVTLRFGTMRQSTHGDSVMQEFGITDNEANELFVETGCGKARTAKQAARYIRRFVARKLKEERVA